jgi:hypothetical protein
VGAPIGHGDIPLRPPFGAAVAAWSRADTVTRWLDLAPAGARPRYAEALEVARRRGYVVELVEPLLPPGPPPAGRSLTEMVDSLADQLAPDVLPLVLDPLESYSIGAINAPVLDATGTVVLIVSLLGFPGRLRGTEVADAGERLRDATAAVSGALGAGRSGGTSNGS